MTEVELLQVERSYAVDLGGKSYTVIESYNTNNERTTRSMSLTATRWTRNYGTN